VEILIAVLILSVVISTIYAAYTGTLRVAQTAEQDDARYAMARVFFMRLTKDMGGLSVYRDGFEFIAKPYEYKDRSFLKISFRSSAHLAASERDISEGVARITYEMLEDKKNGGYRLLRMDSLYDETPPGGNAATPMTQEELLKKSFLICTGIQSLTYKFYDTTGKEYDAWDSASDNDIQKRKAPAMILVRLNLINPDNQERPLSFMTRIALPINKVDREGSSS